MKARLRNNLRWWTVGRVAVALLAWLLLAACASNRGASDGSDEAPALTGEGEQESGVDGGEEETDANQLGRASRETDVVEHGTVIDALSQVLDTAVPFIQGDLLRVRDGGEGFLDFGDGMRLRLFNDTQVEGVRVEATADAPLDVRLFLEEGGFTGTLTQEGGQAVFETPNGAEITVLGTEFFVVFDGEHGEAFVGNFGGGVEVTSAGETVTLGDGFFLEVPGEDHTPGIGFPLEPSMSAFEESAREEGTPIGAAASLREPFWDLILESLGSEEVAFEEIYAVGFFDVDSYGEVFGEGNFEAILYAHGFTGTLCSVTWTGTFEITGQQIIDGGDGSQFELSLSDVTLARSDEAGSMPDDAHEACPESVAADYPSEIGIGSVTLEIPAVNGAMTAASITADGEAELESDVSIYVSGYALDGTVTATTSTSAEVILRASPGQGCPEVAVSSDSTLTFDARSEDEPVWYHAQDSGWVFSGVLEDLGWTFDGDPSALPVDDEPVAACLRCGDGLCSPSIDESASTCAADCPAVCGDGAVTHSEACDPPEGEPADPAFGQTSVTWCDASCQFSSKEPASQPPAPAFDPSACNAACVTDSDCPSGFSCIDPGFCAHHSCP
jgi:hypothetical protein